MSKKHRPQPMPWSDFARWVLVDSRRTRRFLRVLRTILAALVVVGVLLTPQLGAVIGELARSVGVVAR